MKTPLRLISVDLGASNGRVMLVSYDGTVLVIEDVNRFKNAPVQVSGHLYWDVLRQFRNLQDGIRAAVSRAGGTVAAIGISTWGVDYGLISRTGELAANPYHYRDGRTERALEMVLSSVGCLQLFKETGNNPYKYNTVFQLFADRLADPVRLENARALLFMPDLFAWFLTGELGTEFTIASTGQLLKAGTMNWSVKIRDVLGFPEHIFTPVVAPGSKRGCILKSVGSECGASGVPVIAVAGHDTASALVTVAEEEETSAFLSSGTWSVMGTETTGPVLSPRVLEAGFTNEGGAGRRYSLLKNIMGLWILEECRREWVESGIPFDIGILVEQAEREVSFSAFIDPTAELFFSPGRMTEKVRRYCSDTGQCTPATPGAVARVILESLAMEYRRTLYALQRLTGRTFESLRIVGGGSRNRLLSQLAADAAGRPVWAGPVEATTLGNAAVQAVTLGEIANMTEAREVVRASFPPRLYRPRQPELWEAAYRRYLAVVTQKSSTTA